MFRHTCAATSAVTAAQIFLDYPYEKHLDRQELKNAPVM